MKNGRHSPINGAVFFMIDSKTLQLEDAIAYSNALIDYLNNPAHVTHSNYKLAQVELQRVNEYITELEPPDYSDELKLSEANSPINQENGENLPNLPSRRGIAYQQLEQEIVALIEENTQQSELIGAINTLARLAGWTTKDLWSFYYSRQEELERKELETELKEELNSILSFGSRRLVLEELIPLELAKPIQNIAHRLNIRPEVCLTTLLAGISGCHRVGTRLVISESQDWEEPPNLFIGLVSPTGQKKSPITKIFIRRPLGLLQSLARKEHAQKVEQYQQNLQEYGQLSKEDKAERYPDGCPKPPAQPRIHYFSDANVEGINSQVEAHPDQALVYLVEELPKVFNFDKYRNGKGSERQDFLAYYDGIGPTELRRGGVVTNTDEISLSIYGAIQPEKLRQLMTDSTDPDGQWARFIFVNQPLAAATLFDDDSRYEIGDLLAALYRRVNALPKRRYTLDNQAYKKFRHLYNNVLEPERVKNSNPGLRAVYGKTAGRIGRLALNLHVINELVGTDRRTPLDEIGVETMEKAIKLTSFYTDQIKLIHANAQAEQGALAPNLAAVVRRSEEIGWVKARDVQMYGHEHKQTSPNTIREWFLQLESLGYGTCQGRGNRLEFRKNPNK